MSLTRWMHRGHAKVKPLTTKADKMFINPPPRKEAPMQQVMYTQKLLKDVKTALERGVECSNVDQLSDALISMEFFFNLAKQEHARQLRVMASEGQGITVPELFVDQPNQFVHAVKPTNDAYQTIIQPQSDQNNEQETNNGNTSVLTPNFNPS